MPMGIVNDDDFNAEVERTKIVNIERGRGHKNEVPDSLRKIIGENVIEEGRDATKTLTRALGISDSSLSAYSVGANSTTTYHDRPNREHINKAKERIVKKARNRLVQSLNAITPEKLEKEKPRDLAGIAKDMSVIIKNFEPDQEEAIKRQPLIIFAPMLVTEEKYEVINVDT